MIAALLVAAAFGAGHADAVKVARWHQPVCRRCRRAPRLRPRRPSPIVVNPAPGGGPAPAPAPTPAPPRYPSRTSVDLTDDDADGWRVTPAYRTLAAGTVEFNATNLGMDDHDFSVRRGDVVYTTVPLAPGESGTANVVLAPGVYALYCSLPTHEQLGMRTDVTIR